MRPRAEDRRGAGVPRGPVLDLGDQAAAGLGVDELLLDHLPVDGVVDVGGEVEVGRAEAPRALDRPGRRRAGWLEPGADAAPGGGCAVDGLEPGGQRAGPDAAGVEVDPHRDRLDERAVGAAQRAAPLGPQAGRCRCRRSRPRAPPRSAGSARPAGAAGARSRRRRRRPARRRPSLPRRRPGASERRRRAARGRPARRRRARRGRAAGTRARPPEPARARAAACVQGRAVGRSWSHAGRWAEVVTECTRQARRTSSC